MGTYHEDGSPRFSQILAEVLAGAKAHLEDEDECIAVGPYVVSVCGVPGELPFVRAPLYRFQRQSGRQWRHSVRKYRLDCQLDQKPIKGY